MNAGLKVNCEVGPVGVLSPLEILYCGDNNRAYKVAEKLTEECGGDVSARTVNLSDYHLKFVDKDVQMLFYLNKNIFQEGDSLNCESI